MKRLILIVALVAGCSSAAPVDPTAAFTPEPATSIAPPSPSATPAPSEPAVGVGRFLVGWEQDLANDGTFLLISATCGRAPHSLKDVTLWCDDFRIDRVDQATWNSYNPGDPYPHPDGWQPSASPSPSPKPSTKP